MIVAKKTLMSQVEENRLESLESAQSIQAHQLIDHPDKKIITKITYKRPKLVNLMSEIEKRIIAFPQ